MTAPMHLDTSSPKNAGLIRDLLRMKGALGPPIAARDSVPDPYMGQGSHPDVVARVWDRLGATLTEDCRCLLYGTPALVAPASGVVLAAAWGTAYLLRVPREQVREAVRAGAKTVMHWPAGRATDAVEFGPDWVFGAWLAQEPRWCASCYAEAEPR